MQDKDGNYVSFSEYAEGATLYGRNTGELVNTIESVPKMSVSDALQALFDHYMVEQEGYTFHLVDKGWVVVGDRQDGERRIYVMVKWYDWATQHQFRSAINHRDKIVYLRWWQPYAFDPILPEEGAYIKALSDIRLTKPGEQWVADVVPHVETCATCEELIEIAGKVLRGNNQPPAAQGE